MWSYNKKNLIPKLQLRDCPHKIRLVSIVFIGSILAQFLPSFAKISNQTFSLFQEKLTPLTHQKIAVGARWIVLYWKHQFYTVLLLYSKFSNVGDSEKIFFIIHTAGSAFKTWLYWTFSLSKLTPLSHPKNALVFLSAEGWGARFFLIERISSAATLWSCSK